MRIIGLSRWQRIALVAILSLAFTLVVFPIVDDIYLRYFFADETRILPSLVSLGIGIVFYLLGWWSLVGTIGDRLPARRVILLYVGIGLVALFLALLMVIFGFAMATAPTF